MKNEIIKQRIDAYWDRIRLAHNLPENSIMRVYDGIVDENEYTNQKIKILFLLKDGNNPRPYEDGNGYTYKDLYATANATQKTDTKETQVYPMWRVMCMWIRLIEEPNFALEECYTSKNGYELDTMRVYLSRIATVNLKKTPGNSNSLDRELKEAMEYYPLIEEEIEIIDPNIIICGGTFDFVSKEYQETIRLLPNGKRFFVHNGYVFVESRHPSPRGSSYQKCFDTFKETINYLMLNENVKAIIGDRPALSHSL